LFTVAIDDERAGDVMHDLLVRVSRQRNQHAINSGRQRSKQSEKQRSRDMDCLSDVLLTRIFYSGLRSDDLCRCALVCRRWNRLVWNPLLWTCIDLSHSPHCDVDL